MFDGQFNTNKQVNQLRDALVSKKYQAWFIGPNDGGPLTPTIKQAIKQGVKVGCTLVPCGPNIRKAKVQIPGQVIFVGPRLLPERPAARPRRGPGVQEQEPVQGAVAARAADPAAREGAAPGRPLLDHQAPQEHQGRLRAAGGYLAAPALKATQNVLQAHPDMNVVVSSGDQMIAGAYRAEQLAGMAGKVANIGNGCTFEAKQLILAGRADGCSVYLPRTEARLVVRRSSTR